ncbi:32753_t:CDS:2 [Gigaspora margarita]|uniref:32753_t:CDS:1 n=1 Tax=Gigaspora margarita TaxID=4874 RepID=A0ABN7UDX7_GIGMA|nr:32753_t:CDS:2 [Gigaspora margarita]
MYASIINNNPSCKFDTTNIPPCISHCMFSVVVNRKPKELREFIHFSIEHTEYYSITSNSGVNMQITVLYHAGSLRFQNYLGHLGSNIKLDSMYLVSGLFKISTSGKMMIEAADINYMKTIAVIYNAHENYSSTIPGAQSIIDIITNNIESKPTQVLKVVDSTILSINHRAVATLGLSENLINPDVQIDSSLA